MAQFGSEISNIAVQEEWAAVFLDDAAQVIEVPHAEEDEAR